jgi:hypothetical protein
MRALSRTLVLIAIVALAAVIGVGGIVAFAQSTQPALRGGGAMRGVLASPAPAPASGPTRPPLPLGDMRHKGGIRGISANGVYDPLGFLARLPLAQKMKRSGVVRFNGPPLPGKMPKLGQMLKTKTGVRHTAAANGESIVLTGTSATPYLDDQTVAYGATVFWLCENMKPSTTYRYVVWSPDGYQYIVQPAEYWVNGDPVVTTFATDTAGRCEHQNGNEYYPFWAAATLSTPLTGNAILADGATDPNAAASAYSGVWAIAAQNVATGTYEAVAYTVVIGTLNFSTYSNSSFTTVSNDFASGSTAYVKASGLNPAHFYDFGMVNTSGNALPCVYTIPTGSQNVNNATCFENGASGVLPTGGAFSGQWTTPATGANAAGTYSIELYDATTDDLISTQQVSINPSTLTWNTLVPYSTTGGTGTNLNNTFATDGLVNIEGGAGNSTIDQSVTGLDISGSGTTSGHVYDLTLSNANGVILSSGTTDTGGGTPSTFGGAAQFFNAPLSFTATGTTFTENNVAFPINQANLTAYGATSIPFAPNVYTAQLYDVTAGAVIGSKSFQIVSYAGSLQWTSPAGSYVNANAAGVATPVTTTITNTAGTLYGSWDGDGIKQVTIEQDSTAKVTLTLQAGVTTATDSTGQTWNLSTYTDAITGAPGIKAVPAVAGESLPVNATLPIKLNVAVATGNCTTACILRTTITPLHGIAESIVNNAMTNLATNGLEVFGFNVAGNNSPTYSWSVGAYTTTSANLLPTPRYNQMMYVSGTNGATSASATNGVYTVTLTVNNTGGTAAMTNVDFFMPATWYPSTVTPTITKVINNGANQTGAWAIDTQDGGNGSTTNGALGSNEFEIARTGTDSIAVGQTAVFTLDMMLPLSSFPFQTIPATYNLTSTNTIGATNTTTNAIAGATNIASNELGVYSLNPSFMNATITPAVVAAQAGASFTFAFTNTSSGLDPNPDYISQLLITVPSAGGVFPSSVAVTSPNQTGVTWHANATATTGQYLIDLCTNNTVPSQTAQTSTPCAAATDANALPPGDTLDVTFTYATAPGVSSNLVPWTVVGANGGGVAAATTTPTQEEPTLDVANTTAQTSFTYVGGYTATPVYPPVAPITAVPSNSQPTIGAWANYNDGNAYVFQLYNNGSTPITDVSIQIPSSNTSGQIFDTQDWSVIASSIYTYGAGAAGGQCSANGYKTLTEPVRGSPGTPGIITLHGCNVAVGQSLSVFFYALSPYDIGSTFNWPASVADNATPASPATNANTLAAYSLSNTVRVIDEAALQIQIPTGTSPTFSYNPALFGPSDAPTISCPNCTFTTGGTYPVINLNSITGTFNATDSLAASVYSDSANGWTLYVAADQNPQISPAGGPALYTWIDKTASSHPGSGTYTPSATADTSPGVQVPTTGTLQLSTFTGAALHTPIDNLMSFQLLVGSTVLSASQTNTITLTYTLIAN